MADLVYNHFKTNLMSGNINLGTANIMCMLVSGAYTPNADTHANTGHVNGDVVVAGHPKGGVKIHATSVFMDTAEDEGVLTGHSVTFTGITCSPAWMVVYVSGATVATNYLIQARDLGSQTITNADFSITWNSEGIWNLT